MELRSAKVSDCEMVYRILHENAVWLETRKIVQWPIPWLESKREEIFKSVKYGEFFIAYKQNAVVAVVEIKTEPESMWGFDGGASLYIHKLALSAGHRGKGIGREVIRKIVSRAKKDGFQYIRLDCVANNKKLCEYYCASGFRFKGVANNGEVDVALYELPALECVPQRPC